MSALLKHLRELDDGMGMWWEFTWECEDRREWGAALDAVKRIPCEFRRYDPKSKRWAVSIQYEDDLAAIFPNFRGALEALQSQGRLFT